MYLADLIASIPKENHFLHHVLDLLECSRHKAVAEARLGDPIRFRNVFSGVSKENACTRGKGIPFGDRHAFAVTETVYEEFNELFKTVSKDNARKFYGVSFEEYVEWMTPTTQPRRHFNH